MINSYVDKFTILNTCYAICCMSLGIVAPFFPPYAYSIGIDSQTLGLVFAVQSVGAFIGSLKVGQLLNKENRILYMEYGMIIQGFCLTVYVIAYIIGRPGIVTIVILLIRIINGIAFSMFTTAFYSMIPSLYLSTIESKIAMAEMASAFGFVAGPVIGSVLHSIGGFVLTFITFSLVSLISGIALKQLNYGFTELIVQVEMIELSTIPPPLEQLTYMYSLSQYSVVVHALIGFMVNVAITYNQPILADYLINQFDISEGLVGCYMALHPLAYTIASSIIIMTKMQNKSSTMIFGLFLASICQFYFGPDEYFTQMSPNLTIFCIAQMIAGFVVAYPFICTLPQLNECLYKLCPEDRENCHNIAAGLFMASCQLGGLIGPAFSGHMRLNYQYDRISSFIGIMMMMVVVSYIPFVIQNN